MDQHKGMYHESSNWSNKIKETDKIEKWPMKINYRNRDSNNRNTADIFKFKSIKLKII